MKRSRKTASLSKSLNHQLNSYALAASAAGVGVLALASPAEGKIIYTPAHIIIGAGQTYKLDLNHDGIVDFGLQIYTCSTENCSISRKEFFIYGHSSDSDPNFIQVLGSTRGSAWFAVALRKGDKIFRKGARAAGVGVLVDHYLDTYAGNWFPNVMNRYLGLTFYIGGTIHYGWARVSVKTARYPLEITGILTGYAYETIPNKDIIAGKTKGPDVITVQPASLGHLAHGASAISAWRGKDQ